jgi:hypothetical protein
MTKDDIERMGAGEKMNEAIARRVMNLIPCDQWQEMNFGSAGGPGLIKQCDHENCYPSNSLPSIGGTVGGCPPYSTEIGAAMTVFQRLRESDAWCCLTIKSDHAYVWDVHLTPSNWEDTFSHEPAVKVTSTLLPLAICRAALLAVSPVGEGGGE